MVGRCSNRFFPGLVIPVAGIGIDKTHPSTKTTRTRNRSTRTRNRQNGLKRDSRNGIYKQNTALLDPVSGIVIDRFLGLDSWGQNRQLIPGLDHLDYPPAYNTSWDPGLDHTGCCDRSQIDSWDRNRQKIVIDILFPGDRLDIPIPGLVISVPGLDIIPVLVIGHTGWANRQHKLGHNGWAFPPILFHSPLISNNGGVFPSFSININSWAF